MTVTHTQASFEGRTCNWSYDYDDVTLKLLTFRCVNDSNGASEGKVRAIDSVGTPLTTWYVVTVQPHTTYVQAVPQAVANAFNIGVDARGRLTGIDQAYRMLGA